MEQTSLGLTTGGNRTSKSPQPMETGNMFWTWFPYYEFAEINIALLISMGLHVYDIIAISIVIAAPTGNNMIGVNH